jgi:hypothetical protein
MNHFAQIVTSKIAGVADDPSVKRTILVNGNRLGKVAMVAGPIIFLANPIGGGLVAAAGTAVYFITRKRRKQIEAQEAAAAKAKLMKEAWNAAETFWKTIKSDVILIDSNIWMNEDYSDFFTVLEYVLKKNKYVIPLYGPQFDEICNLKKTTDFGDAKNRRSRIAINRIEAFQKESVLDVKPITIEAQRGAYADPLLVKLVTTTVKSGKTATFISDDKELRIRVRQHVKDVNTGHLLVPEMSSFVVQPILAALSEGLN